MNPYSGRRIRRAARPSHAQPARSTDRRGTVIIIVTVVVALLTLGGYLFAEFMVVEYRAAAAFGREAQARALADSGVETAASLLSSRASRTPLAYYNAPASFQGVLVQNSTSARGRGRFSVVAGVENAAAGSSLRFGLVDEAARLNLNAFEDWGLPPEQQRAALMRLPKMTEDVADAILDFLDADESPRELGAENEYYQSLGLTARNGKLEAIDELLLVRGVTPELLFGEDANRNGLLDPNENDGEKSLPLDDGDGVLFPGWSAWFTIYSQELNVRDDGQAKIDLNMNALGDLYDKLQPEFGEDVAKFIVAYRMSGALQSASGGSGEATSGSQNMAGGGAQSGGTNGGGSSSGGGASGSSRTAAGGGTGQVTAQRVGGLNATTPQQTNQPVQNSARVTTAANVNTPVQNSARITTATQVQQGQGVQNFASAPGFGNNSQSSTTQAVSAAANSLFSGAGKVTRAGIDLTNGGQVKINSLYELVGVQVQAAVNGTNTTLDSPFAADANAMRTYLPKAMNLLTADASRILTGRVNINEARLETLLGIPGMTETLAAAIVNQQASFLAAGGDSTDMATTGWLYLYNLADIPTLTALDKYITTRGDVYRVHSVGFFDEGGIGARVEAVVDATQTPPQVVFQRDLSNLGVGYSVQTLSGGG